MMSFWRKSKSKHQKLDLDDPPPDYNPFSGSRDIGMTEMGESKNSLEFDVDTLGAFIKLDSNAYCVYQKDKIDPDIVKMLEFKTVFYIGSSNLPFESMDVTFVPIVYPGTSKFDGKNVTPSNRIKDLLDISCSTSKKVLIHIDSMEGVAFVIEGLMKFKSIKLIDGLELFKVFTLPNELIEVLMVLEKRITKSSSITKETLLIQQIQSMIPYKTITEITDAIRKYPTIEGAVNYLLDG